MTDITNEERDCLRNALGIAIAGMKRHDRIDIDYNNHPASLCLVDFSSEIELCQNALDSGFECDDCDGSGIYYIDGQPQKCICSEPQE